MQSIYPPYDLLRGRIHAMIARIELSGTSHMTSNFLHEHGSNVHLELSNRRWDILVYICTLRMALEKMNALSEVIIARDSLQKSDLELVL